jgi:hypothetical protein
MLKDDSQRGYKKMLQLPENDPAVFGVFMTWLYQDIIEKPTDSAEEVKRERLLIKLVAFAEKYNISDLADSTLDFLINFFSDIRQFPSGATTYVYKSTQTGSRLRRLYTKSLAFLTLKRGCKNWVDNYLCATLKSHKDILPDYIEELIVQSRIKLVNPLKLPACTFHGHGKDEPCAIASKKRKRAVDNE